MSAPQKLIGFVVGLVAVFALSFGIGSAVAPRSTPAAGHGSGHDAGYTLELDESRLPSGGTVPLRFRVIDGNGAPVTDYVESHEKLLHLIVVRRDLATYQHVHPVLDDSGEGKGTWSVPVDLTAPGDYRVFADFVTGVGGAVTLGADLTVEGVYRPQPLPAPATTATVDGYTVTLAGVGTAGEASELTLSVSRDGKPVTDLQPYLGAYGHLVAVRASDLEYLHVHPMSDAADPATPPGPEIAFHTTLPSAGTYRLFLDFKHRDAVHTAEFTVEEAS